jgi:hypothetical protein
LLGGVKVIGEWNVVMMCRVGCVMMDPSFGITSAGGLTKLRADQKPAIKPETSLTWLIKLGCRRKMKRQVTSVEYFLLCIRRLRRLRTQYTAGAA